MLRRVSCPLAILSVTLSCAINPGPRPPPLPPEPARATLAVIVTDARSGRPLEGAAVALHTGETGTTNGDGYLAWELEIGGRGVTITRDGYIERTVSADPFVANMDVPIGIEPRGPPAASARRGLVRREAHAACDDDGCFNPLGATVFWGAWGYKFDRDRLDLNLSTLKDAGVAYLRVLGSVGPVGGWADRTTDINWPDYNETIAGFTDYAYDRFGLRVQWTIFGGSEHTPSGLIRQQVVDRFAAMTAGREHKIFAYEVANEGWQNGFAGGPGHAELRALGRRLQDRVPNIVALTAPQNAADACDTYAGAGARAATMHYERDDRSDSFTLNGQRYQFRPVRQPWGYPDEYDASCNGQLPPVVLNNEPIGPEASINADDQPIDLVTAYLVTFIAQNGGYVFHAGPGIRGGGAADLARAPPRHANFWELPGWSEIAGGFRAMTAALPPGVANWARHNAQWGSFPFSGFDRAVDENRIVRAYAATRGSDFVVAVFGIRAPVTARPRAAIAFDVIHPLTGEVLRHLELAAGQEFTLEGVPTAVLLKGQQR